MCGLLLTLDQPNSFNGVWKGLVPPIFFFFLLDGCS
jgi:hypothetical protein